MPTHAEQLAAIADLIDARGAAKTDAELDSINEFQEAVARWRADNPDIDDSTMRKVANFDEALVADGDMRPYEQRWNLALRKVRGEPSPFMDWGELVQLGGIGSPGEEAHDNAVSVIRFLRTGSFATPEPEEPPEEVQSTVNAMAATRGPQRVQRASDLTALRQGEE